MRLGIFKEQDITHLPEPVQNHFRVSGIIGQSIMSKSLVHVPSASIFRSKNSKPMILDYTLHLFGDRPVRLAYMNNSMFGIPFEVFDSFQDGEGVMKGVLGKIFTLFNETGSEMNRGQLLTYLGEFFLIPSAIFNEHVTWETIDANHVRATITYGELSGSGIFTFNENGFVQSFRTKERAAIRPDGSITHPEWSAVYEGWTRGENGMHLPSNIKAIWHEQDGDFIYFESTRGFTVEFS